MFKKTGKLVQVVNSYGQLTAILPSAVESIRESEEVIHGIKASFVRIQFPGIRYVLTKEPLDEVLRKFEAAS